MSHKYNPSVTDMANAYLVAYGDLGNAMLIGAMFANLDDETIERLYAQVINEIRIDLQEKGLA